MSYVPNFESVLLTVNYTNLAKNSSCVVDVQRGVCMCPYYLKHAYCKHLMHAHGHTHTRSDKIVLKRSSLFEGIQVELGMNVDDHDMPLQL
jgi:hypothetical protein